MSSMSDNNSVFPERYFHNDQTNASPLRVRASCMAVPISRIPPSTTAQGKNVTESVFCDSSFFLGWWYFASVVWAMISELWKLMRYLEKLVNIISKVWMGWQKRDITVNLLFLIKNQVNNITINPILWPLSSKFSQFLVPPFWAKVLMLISDQFNWK